MVYPGDPKEATSTHPKDVIQTITANNIQAREHRDQLTKLINKVKVYQEKLNEQND